MIPLPLVEKEVKDLLRDPRILIPFVISALILPVMGLLVGHFMQERVSEAVSAVNLGIVDLDRSSISRLIISKIKSCGQFKVVELDYSGEFELGYVHEVVKKYKDLEVLVIIPKGFGSSIEKLMPSNMVVVPIVKSVGPGTSAGKASRVSEFVKNCIIDYLSTKLNVNPDVIRNPLVTQYMTYVAGKIVMGHPGLVLASISMISTMMPMVILIVAITTAQMSATSMAVENEERTLETLLTLPVSRIGILMSKLIGSFVVSLLGSAFNLLGLYLYMTLIMRSFERAVSPVVMQKIGGGVGIDISPAEFIIIGISLLLSLFFLSALGIVIGALSSDVRISSTIMGPITMAIIIPGYIVAFMDVSKMPLHLQILIKALPVAQPAIFVKEALIKEILLSDLIFLAPSLLLTFIMLIIVSRIFATEKIITIQKSIEAKIRRKR